MGREWVEKYSEAEMTAEQKYGGADQRREDLKREFIYLSRVLLLLYKYREKGESVL